MKYYILGDIKRPVSMSRLEAERILGRHFFYIPGKSKEECKAYKNSVCVIHLESDIEGRAPIDVDWIFSDKSLYQMADGKFFILYQGSAPYGGGIGISAELEKNYFDANNVSSFMDLLRISSLDELTATPAEVDSLFKKRELTFYAERWCSYDYIVLFDLFGYGRYTKEAVRELVEEYHKKFENSPDRELLLAHIEKESGKALEAIEKGTFGKHEDEDNKFNAIYCSYRE